jgi:hypothetical protein
VADVHVPSLGEHGGGGKSILKLVLEVALIGIGVFLGLAGEQWRENARHHEMADAALRRFRAEVVTNRDAVAKVSNYHIDRETALKTYLAAARKNEPAPAFHLNGIQPVFFERTAWDLAIATQSLAYVESDLAFEISRAYRTQDNLDGLSRGLMQAMYLKPPVEGDRSFLEALGLYYGDATLIEPELLKRYGELLPRLDHALAR